MAEASAARPTPLGLAAGAEQSRGGAPSRRSPEESPAPSSRDSHHRGGQHQVQAQRPSGPQEATEILAQRPSGPQAVTGTLAQARLYSREFSFSKHKMAEFLASNLTFEKRQDTTILAFSCMDNSEWLSQSRSSSTPPTGTSCPHI